MIHRLVCLILLLVLLLPSGDVPPDVEARVTRVVDGDTIWIEYSGQPYKVRYIGVDTPEVYFGVQCYGPEASQANKSLVDAQMVRLVKDTSAVDHYGRLLRYVYLGDVFVNVELMEHGYAR